MYIDYQVVGMKTKWKVELSIWNMFLLHKASFVSLNVYIDNIELIVILKTFRFLFYVSVVS